MKNVIVLGAGRIGRCIAELLARRGDIRVTLGDQNLGAFEGVSASIRRVQLDVSDPEMLGKALSGHEVVLSACQFSDSVRIAEVALEKGLSYFDLTEDVAATEAIRELSKKAAVGQVFVPQCGMPGRRLRLSEPVGPFRISTLIRSGCSSATRIAYAAPNELATTFTGWPAISRMKSVMSST
jgi:hypothetical protein